MHIIGVIVERSRWRRCRRVAVAAQIDAEYGEIPAQFGSHWLEEGEIEPNRMQQNHMRAAAGDLVVERWSDHGIVLAKRGGRRQSAMNFGWRVSRQQSVHNLGRKL
jgi:hypothetical protein